MAITERTRRAKSKGVKQALDGALFLASAIRNEMYDEKLGFANTPALAAATVVAAINQALEQLAWYEAWAREQTQPAEGDE